MGSPTSRSLAALRKDGWTCYITEKFNTFSKIRIDAFGFGDILACSPTRGIMLVQACAIASQAARIAKIRAEPRHAIWLASKGRIQVMAWGKHGAKGKRKLWTCSTTEITSAPYPENDAAQVPHPQA